MVGCQRAGMRINKKLQKFSPASILACGPGNKISLKNHSFSQKSAILKVIFVLSS